MAAIVELDQRDHVERAARSDGVIGALLVEPIAGSGLLAAGALAVDLDERAERHTGEDVRGLSSD